MAKTPNRGLQLRPVTRNVAVLAGITGDDELEPFCDYLCDTIRMVKALDRHATSSKAGRALTEAAQAALTLNRAVCSLKAPDQAWVNKVADKHPLLSRETRIRGKTRPFEINELRQSTWLLALLFSFAVNRSSPEMAGISVGSGKKAQKWGIGSNMLFEFFLRRLLTSAKKLADSFHSTRTIARALWLKRLISWSRTYPA
jgi:hypothetical protein